MKRSLRWDWVFPCLLWDLNQNKRNRGVLLSLRQRSCNEVETRREYVEGVCECVFMMIEGIGCERRGERGGDSVSDVVESQSLELSCSDECVLISVVTFLFQHTQDNKSR